MANLIILLVQIVGFSSAVYLMFTRSFADGAGLMTIVVVASGAFSEFRDWLLRLYLTRLPSDELDALDSYAFLGIGKPPTVTQFIGYTCWLMQICVTG